MSGGTMKDNNTTSTPEAWKMRFLANGTSGTWFYTDDIAVTDAWLRAHPDDVEVIPLCRIQPRQHSHTSPYVLVGTHHGRTGSRISA